MSFIFIGHFVWELINMQLQRIFYHPLRVGDPSLFPYHLQHLAWTFQVVYQTDAFSCKPPLLLRISCPVLLHLHILWVRTQRPSPPRSSGSEFKIRLSVQVDCWCDTRGIFTMGILSLRLLTIAQVSAVLLSALVTLGGAQRYKVMT